jgi:hypothetical protein
LKFTVKFWNLENITEILLFGKQWNWPSPRHAPTSHFPQIMAQPSNWSSPRKGPHLPLPPDPGPAFELTIAQTHPPPPTSTRSWPSLRIDHRPGTPPTSHFHQILAQPRDLLITCHRCRRHDDAELLCLTIDVFIAASSSAVCVRSLW